MNIKWVKVIFGGSFLLGAVGFGFGAYMFFPQGITAGGVGFSLATLAFVWVALSAIFGKTFGFGNSLSSAQVSQLKTGGQQIMAEFKALDRLWNIKINGQSPIVVYAQDDQGRTYESENLWFSGADSAAYNDPRFIAWQKLQSKDPAKKYLIPVYINPQKPTQYFMDLDGLEIK